MLSFVLSILPGNKIHSSYDRLTFCLLQCGTEVVDLIGSLKVVEVTDRPFEKLCYCWRPHREYELWIGSAHPFIPGPADELRKAFPCDIGRAAGELIRKFAGEFLELALLAFLRCHAPLAGSLE